MQTYLNKSGKVSLLRAKSIPWWRSSSRVTAMPSLIVRIHLSTCPTASWFCGPALWVRNVNPAELWVTNRRNRFLRIFGQDYRRLRRYQTKLMHPMNQHLPIWLNVSCHDNTCNATGETFFQCQTSYTTLGSRWLYLSICLDKTEICLNLRLQDSGSTSTMLRHPSSGQAMWQVRNVTLHTMPHHLKIWFSYISYNAYWAQKRLFRLGTMTLRMQHQPRALSPLNYLQRWQVIGFMGHLIVWLWKNKIPSLIIA